MYIYAVMDWIPFPTFPEFSTSKLRPTSQLPFNRITQVFSFDLPLLRDLAAVHGLAGGSKKGCKEDILHLVGGFKHDFYFPFHIWDVILPIDKLIFFKMVKTTNQ